MKYFCIIYIQLRNVEILHNGSAHKNNFLIILIICKTIKTMSTQAFHVIADVAVAFGSVNRVNAFIRFALSPILNYD